MAESLASSNLLKEISRSRSGSQRPTKKLDEWGFAEKKLRCGKDLPLKKSLISKIQRSICLMKTDYPSNILVRLDLMTGTIQDDLMKKEFDTLHSELLWLFVKHQVEVTRTEDIKEQEKRDHEILLKLSERSQSLEKYEIFELKFLEFEDKELLIQSLKEELIFRLENTDSNISIVKDKLKAAESENVTLHEKLDALRSTGTGQSMLLEMYEKLESKCKSLECKDEKNSSIGKKLVGRLNDTENRLSIIKGTLTAVQGDNVTLQKELGAFRTRGPESGTYSDGGF